MIILLLLLCGCKDKTQSTPQNLNGNYSCVLSSQTASADYIKLGDSATLTFKEPESLSGMCVVLNNQGAKVKNGELEIEGAAIPANGLIAAAEILRLEQAENISFDNKTNLPLSFVFKDETIIIEKFLKEPD